MGQVSEAVVKDSLLVLSSFIYRLQSEYLLLLVQLPQRGWLVVLCAPLRRLLSLNWGLWFLLPVRLTAVA